MNRETIRYTIVGNEVTVFLTSWEEMETYTADVGFVPGQWQEEALQELGFEGVPVSAFNWEEV